MCSNHFKFQEKQTNLEKETEKKPPPDTLTETALPVTRNLITLLCCKVVKSRKSLTTSKLKACWVNESQIFFYIILILKYFGKVNTYSIHSRNNLHSWIIKSKSKLFHPKIILTMKCIWVDKDLLLHSFYFDGQ